MPGEDGVRDSGANWTVLRCAWFAQNFSEHFLLQPVLDGVIALPAGDIAEPFLDTEDVADVAVAALTQERHAGRTYELTGPRLLTFADVAAELTRATRREIRSLGVLPEHRRGGVWIGWSGDANDVDVPDSYEGIALRSVPISAEEYAGAAAEAGVPAEEIEPLSELFTRILDGHNAHLTDDIERVLGRRPRDFADYAHDAAATGVWSKAGETEGSVR